MTDNRAGQRLDIRAACRELLGEQWAQSLPVLATMLGINLRSLQRMTLGDNAVPDGIAARVGELLAVARRSRADAARDRARRAEERATGEPGGDIRDIADKHSALFARLGKR